MTKWPLWASVGFTFVVCGLLWIGFFSALRPVLSALDSIRY